MPKLLTWLIWNGTSGIQALLPDIDADYVGQLLARDSFDARRARILLSLNKPLRECRSSDVHSFIADQDPFLKLCGSNTRWDDGDARSRYFEDNPDVASYVNSLNDDGYFGKYECWSVNYLRQNRQELPHRFLFEQERRK